MIAATLDVNVLVSAVIAPLGNPRRILTVWRDGRLSVKLSVGIVAEVEAKLRSPRIGRKYKIDDDDIRAVRTLFETQAELVDVPPDECPVITGDPEDDAVLAAARLGGVTYLVTGDRGLLDLRQHAGVTIVSPRAFMDLLVYMNQAV